MDFLLPSKSSSRSNRTKKEGYFWKLVPRHQSLKRCSTNNLLIKLEKMNKDYGNGHFFQKSWSFHPSMKSSKITTKFWLKLRKVRFSCYSLFVSQSFEFIKFSHLYPTRPREVPPKRGVLLPRSMRLFRTLLLTIFCLKFLYNHFGFSNMTWKSTNFYMI